MKYPYIQKKEKIKDFICDNCKRKSELGYRLEWRVDFFQGNCEFEKTCYGCFSKAIIEDKKRKEKEAVIYRKELEAYQRKEKPKWEKLEALLKENKIEVKKYEDTGQWCFNSLIDWWTTTGTAMNRKTRQRYHFLVEEPMKIINTIIESK